MKRSGFKQKPRKPLKRTSFKRKKASKTRKIAPGRTKTKKRAPTKKNRVKTLKRKLWEVFSQYIRQREADDMGMVVTCDLLTYEHWKGTHCGHLFTNSERNQQLGGNELWYYENNFAPQSMQGNVFNSDDAAKKYLIYAIKKYGLEEVEHMQRLKQTYKLWTEEELQEKLTHYQTLLSSLQQTP